jgi:UDP-N-acetylmuramate: L-alanyl-gamma-D-glutamyl-meso-diaminopimelate ligase
MLEEQGVEIIEGYRAENFTEDTDCIVVGNAMSRGNEAVESMLNRNLNYTSGPQWLHENILNQRWVLAVAGTHGKTTTASMLTWILEYAGLNPGFLIGGVPENFGLSARLGDSPFFVVEADEYDTAFFDKRSKFVHYHPRTAILNNLEFDHADIFADLEAIKTQFHHLIRTIPSEGKIINNAAEPALADVIDKGCWTEIETFSGENVESEWSANYIQADGSTFEVLHQGKVQGCVEWTQMGQHNVSNALAAIAAARHAGVPITASIAALGKFAGVKRRMQLRGEVNSIRVYDDFAHHPTAIDTTLKGLRANVGTQRIIAILEPRSNTMRMGVHKARIAAALAQADEVILYQPASVNWDMQSVIDDLGEKAKLFENVDKIVDYIATTTQENEHILVMSNGGFEAIHAKILDRL